MSDRLKKRKCEHQWPEEPHCQPAFHNHYYCDHCDVSWTDVWSCAVDDECPECGKDISPEESRQVAPCACEAV